MQIDRIDIIEYTNGNSGNHIHLIKLIYTTFRTQPICRGPISVAVCEINVNEWRDLENQVRGRSRSLTSKVDGGITGSRLRWSILT